MKQFRSRSTTTKTFKYRVQEFWNWYPTVAQRFYETIEKGDCARLAEEVSRFVTAEIPHLAWAFGPGAPDGHSFTISGEGQLPKQLLAEYWLSQAPPVDGWTFYSSRQPSPQQQLSGLGVEVGKEKRVDAENLMLDTQVDEENQVIDAVVWHDSLSEVPQEHHAQILFILLDEALGEFGTQTWLGEIQIQPFDHGPHTRTLVELPAFLKQVERYHRWEKLPPLETYSMYEVAEQHDFPRGDTLVGTTCIPHVVFDLLENQGILPEDPLADTGAEFVYLAVDSSVFPDGKQSEVRGDIEDALTDRLAQDASGRVLGGAFGLHASYIDLILFDGDRSRELIQSTLADLQLHSKARLGTFF